jgi:cardiolipin synthase
MTNPLLKHLPNALTISRIASTPVIAYAVVKQEHELALALFGYAATTDFLDGFLARRLKAQSILGSFLDPFADKFLVGIMTVALSASGQMPLWLGGVVLGRDLALICGAAYYRSKSMQKPYSISQFFNVSNVPTHEIRPSVISKVNTALQFAYIAGSLINPVVSIEYLPQLGHLVGITTVWSGIDYALIARKGMQGI